MNFHMLDFVAILILLHECEFPVNDENLPEYCYLVYF